VIVAYQVNISIILLSSCCWCPLVWEMISRNCNLNSFDALLELLTYNKASLWSPTSNSFETIGLETISGHQFFDKTHDALGVHDFLKIWAILLTILNKRSAPAVLAAVKAARSKYATTKVTVVDRSLSKSWSDSVFPLVLIAVYLQEVLLLWFPQPSYLWTYRRVLCLKRSLMGVHA